MEKINKSELTVYTLQRKYDEFKDLSYWQLMKILELLDGQADFNLKEEVKCLAAEIDDLNNTISDLEYDYEILLSKNELLQKKLISLKNKL